MADLINMVWAFLVGRAAHTNPYPSWILFLLGFRCMYSPDKILSVCFYYLPFSDSPSVLQDLEICCVYSSLLFLSAFIKSASSLRKNLVFHSMCEVWPWSCLDPGTATDHLQLCMCCREHKLTVLGHFCELYPCRQGVRTYTWFQAKSDPYTEDYIRKKDNVWHRQRMT